MIISMILFQVLLFFLLLFPLPVSVVIGIGVVLFGCVMVAYARAEAVCNEIEELRREVEELKKER